MDQQPESWVLFISLLSLLAFSTKSWLLQTLKASSTKVDNWVCDPASSFCNFLQVAGVALVVKFMANSVLLSAGSGAVLVPFLNASVTPLEKLPDFHLFLYDFSDLIIIYRLHHTAFPSDKSKVNIKKKVDVDHLNVQELMTCYLEQHSRKTCSFMRERNQLQS